MESVNITVSRHVQKFSEACETKWTQQSVPPTFMSALKICMYTATPGFINDIFRILS